VQGCAGVEQGYATPDGLREGRDDVQVLREQVGRHVGRFVRVRGDKRAAHLEHPRVAGAGGQGVDHQSWIESRADPEHDRLGCRGRVDGDQVVGEVLHHRSGPERAEHHVVAGDRVEHRAAGLERIEVTAREHDDVAGERLLGGPADGAVEQHDSGAGSHVVRTMTVIECQRARLDHGQGSAPGGQQSVVAVEHGVECSSRRQGRQHAPGLLGDLARATGDPAAPLRQFVAPTARDVVPDDGQACGEQVNAHGAAHATQPDDADRVRHRDSSRRCGFREGSSRSSGATSSSQLATRSLTCDSRPVWKWSQSSTTTTSHRSGHASRNAAAG